MIGGFSKIVDLLPVSPFLLCIDAIFGVSQPPWSVDVKVNTSPDSTT